MSGYNWSHGMSNNAVAAYATGEKPKSKWSKADMVEVLNDEYGDIPGLEKLTKAEMFDRFFYCSSWHHCSGAFNKVDFYSVRNIDNPAELIDEIIASRQPKTKTVEQVYTITAKVEYKITVGTYRHYRQKWVTDTVTYKSTDKLVMTAHGNKRLSSLHILEVIK